MRGAAAQALQHLTQADAFWRDLNPESRWAGESALWLGRAYLSLERRSEALTALARAERLLALSPFAGDAELRKLTHAR
jgi:tetratricopeptide (TPR) repeat protein